MGEAEFNRAVELLRKADFIYIIGNGGAASQADHLACDLLKGAGRKAISLGCNGALVTAIANDLSYDHIFLEQLEVLFDPDDDVLVALSTSGKSRNVVNAAQIIHGVGGQVIAVTGTDGGALKDWATVTLRLEADNTQHCEDLMAGVCHQLYMGVLDK